MTAIEMARFGMVEALAMPARHRSRQRALQVLFLWDRRKQPIDEAIAAFYETLGSEEDDPAAHAVPTNSWRRWCAEPRRRPREIDQRITAKSEHWRLERMPAVDRNILRLAVYEMTELETPAPVVIDEALELARQFSGDESVSFINGVLDAVRRDAGSADYAVNPLRVVLVSPRNPLNIGAAARAMSNFGFSELRLVNPYEVAFREARSAVKAQAGAGAGAGIPTVAEAVADCALVVGTTSIGPSRAGASAAAPGIRRQADREEAGVGAGRAAVRIGKIRPVERRYEPLPLADAHSRRAKSTAP